MHQLRNPGNLPQIPKSRNDRTNPPSSLCTLVPLFEHIGKEETDTHSTPCLRRETKAAPNAVTKKSRKSLAKRKREEEEEEEEEEEIDVEFPDATTAGEFSKLDRRLGAPIGKVNQMFALQMATTSLIKPTYPYPLSEEDGEDCCGLNDFGAAWQATLPLGTLAGEERMSRAWKPSR